MATLPGILQMICFCHQCHQCLNLAKFRPLLIIDGVRLAGLKEAILRRLFALLTNPTLKRSIILFIIAVVIIVVIINIMIILRGVILRYLSKILTWCYLQSSLKDTYVVLDSLHRLQLQYPFRSPLLPNRRCRLVKLNIKVL